MNTRVHIAAEMITLQEYKEKMPSRLLDDQLQENQIYHFMTRIDSEKIEAWRIATAIQSIERGYGFIAIELCLLHDDLRTATAFNTSIDDGFWNPGKAGLKFSVQSGSDTGTATKGYFVNYNDGINLSKSHEFFSHDS